MRAVLSKDAVRLEPPSPEPSPDGRGTRSDVLITGIGIVLPGAIGNDALPRAARTSAACASPDDTGPIPESDYRPLLNARRVRRMSDT